MLVSIAGLNSQLGLRLTDTTRPQQLAQLQREPMNQRAVDAFLKGIGSISSPKELTDNFEVYSFVMRAFDLEDQIFGRGLMRKMLESDPDDETSLVNRLTDSRFREIHSALGFTKSGEEKPDFTDPAWQQAVINKFFNQAFENSVDEQNLTVGTVLKFRREVSDINNWFDVLRDRELSSFFRTALGLPEQMAGIDVDKQKKIFESKLDLSTILDPKVQERLINRYMAIADIQSPPSAASSTALSVLQSTGGLGVIVSLNVPPVSISASSLFR